MSAPPERARATTTRVRRADPGDVAAMHEMICELALYERSPELVVATPDDLSRALFGAPAEDEAAEPGGAAPREPSVFAFMAEARQEGSPTWGVVGMALWFRTYSTWTGRHGIWLEDLYVRPAARGSGVGRQLLAALARECVDSGYRRLEWSVLDWNTDAQAVYTAVGAVDHEGWSTWRLDGDALGELAASASSGSSASAA